MRWVRIMVLVVWLAMGVRVDALGCGPMLVLQTDMPGQGSDWGNSTQISLEDLDIEDIQQFLDNLESENVVDFSGMVQEIMSGNLAGVVEQGAQSVKAALFAEIRTNTKLMGQIVVLALIGAMFSGFSGIFGSGHVSETGFYVVYILTMTFLSASFFASVEIAGAVTDRILEFMKVLLPAYFMAVTMAGGAITSASICGFTFGAIGVVQTVLSELLIPLTRIYMLMVLAGNLYKEDMISKLTELMENAITWTMKTMFGIVVGFHVIQGLVLPQADALKNASVTRLAQMIPGVGAGAGAASQMVMGAGVLIKNSAGVAAVVVLIVMAAVPLVKLVVLMVLYYMAGAVMQPVCDKRLVACLTGAASGHGLLIRIVGYSLALFVVTIAVLCASTNAVWYAG